MFLEKEELITVATMDVVNILTGMNDEIVHRLVDESIGKMRSYLSRYYDDELIFSQTDSDRNSHILKLLKDIVIYEVYERHTRENNLVAQRRYEEAMQWLTDINSGALGDRTLPPRQPDDSAEPGTSGDSRFGGNTRYTSTF